MSTSHHPEGGATRVRRRPRSTLHAGRAGFVAALCAILGIGVQNAFAAGVIGVVTQSSQASMGGSPVLRGQTVLDGDRLLVGDGAAVILLAGTTRVILRRDTEVWFQRDPDGAAVALLARGDLSFSHDGDNPEILIRTGNVTIRPANRLRTQGVVTILDGALTIAAASGSVRVEGVGQPLEVAEGKALHLESSEGDAMGGDAVGNPGGNSGGATAGTASGTTAGTTAGNSSGNSTSSKVSGPIWGNVVLCGLAGGILGSIPVIDKEASVSADVGPYWAAIPGGIAAGALICNYVPVAAPPKCTLTASPPVVNLGDMVTLSWSSPRGYNDYLSTVGPEPSSGTIQVVPSQTGVNNWELTANGALGTLVCDARVNVAAPAPCTLCYTTDDGKDFKLRWSVPEGATDAVLKDTASGEEWPLKGQSGTQDVSPATRRQYSLTYKIDGKPRICTLWIDLPSCAIRARKVAKGYVVEWTAWGADSSTLEPEIKPPDKKYVGSAYVNPKEETDYTLTVKGHVYKDVCDWSKGKINLESSCTTTISPLACTIDVDPTQVTAPAKVTVTWDSPNAKKPVTLTALTNNKPIAYPKNDPPNPQNNPPASQDRNVTATTEFVLNVTGQNGEKATCRACVLNRPAEGKGKILDIPPIFQKNPMWCWLTVSEMIFKSRTPPVPGYNPWKPAGLSIPPLLDPDKLYQWGILALAHPACWLHPDACAMVGGNSWENMQRVLRIYPPGAGQQGAAPGAPNPNKPVGSTLKPGCLTADEIKKEIDAGRPIVVGISPGTKPAPGTPAHVALIVGYQVLPDGDIELIVNDPWPYHLRPGDTNPYTTKEAGGSRNCDANYTVDRKKFCAEASWNGSLIGIQ